MQEVSGINQTHRVNNLRMIPLELYKEGLGARFVTCPWDKKDYCPAGLIKLATTIAIDAAIKPTKCAMSCSTTNAIMLLLDSASPKNSKGNQTNKPAMIELAAPKLLA